MTKDHIEEAFSTERALKLALAWFERNTYGDEAVDVYDAIKQALAAPVQGKADKPLPDEFGLPTPMQTPPMPNVNPPKPAPVQEPVAYEYGDDVFWHDSPDINDYIRANGKPLVYATSPYVATPLAAQRPVPEERKSVRSTWVGLTDEEIKAVIAKIDPNEHYLPNSLRQLSLALEAKLKEKNSD